ncbi:hypothetical protein JL721_6504 [Aureococcus anophagefferens]|nr:hypothetical protein JL721_6504 [Aureococcus anophagefferens]
MSEPRAKVRGPYQDADTLQAPVTHVSGNCWVHAKSAIDKPEYRKLFRAQDNRARFKADVIDLANMSVVVRPQKKVLLSLFKAKWGGLEPVATRRWCAEYVDDERKNICKDFFLRGTCEHVLAWDIKNKKVEVPPQWDITVIGTKAKRGCKPNAKRGGALTEKPKSLFTTA